MKRLLTIRLLWASILIGLVSFFGLFILAGNGTFGEMPQFEQLENPNTNLATQIISSDGEILGKYYFNDNRTPITYDELPKNLVDALIATEDERFYDHPGIDVRSTLRAIVFLNTRGGSSTISQQLARQLFVGVRSRNIIQAILQKAREWVLAIQIEKRYIYVFSAYAEVFITGACQEPRGVFPARAREKGKAVPVRAGSNPREVSFSIFLACGFSISAAVVDPRACVCDCVLISVLS